MTPKEYIESVVRTESIDFDAIAKRLQDPHTIRLLHAIMGMETEVGELMDALKKHLFYGKVLDEINLMEEGGDLSWYMGLFLDELKVTWEEVWERNIAKLQARYGDKFTETKAENRDLEKERSILEDR